MWCEKTIVSCGERRMRRRWHGNIYIRIPDLFFCNSELCDVAFREKELAKKYHDKLFKEYCIADLSRYKENKVCGVFFRFFLLWSFKIAYPLIFVTTELTSLYCFTSLVLDGALKMKLYLEKVIDFFLLCIFSVTLWYIKHFWIDNDPFKTELEIRRQYCPSPLGGDAMYLMQSTALNYKQHTLSHPNGPSLLTSAPPAVHILH